MDAGDADGVDRDGAWVTELTDHLDVSAWPEGSRLICRSEGPHPGLLHVAAKLVRDRRRTHLKLDRDWPWTQALATAFQRLRTNPMLC